RSRRRTERRCCGPIPDWSGCRKRRQHQARNQSLQKSRQTPSQRQGGPECALSGRSITGTRASFFCGGGFIFAVSRKISRQSAFRRSRSESTRLNSSHVAISYAVFCLKKKKA